MNAETRTATYLNTLAKGSIRYHFAIFADENQAYIEKWDESKDRDGEDGYFTIGEARKCWKALKAKGFVEFCDYLEDYPDIVGGWYRDPGAGWLPYNKMEYRKWMSRGCH